MAHTSCRDLKIVNENSAHFTVYAKWLACEDDSPVVPESLTYRIDDLETGQNIRPETPVTPASPSTPIVVTSTDARILDASHEYERRRITVTGLFGTEENGDPKVDSWEYDYLVKNLRFVG